MSYIVNRQPDVQFHASLVAGFYERLSISKPFQFGFCEKRLSLGIGIIIVQLYKVSMQMRFMPAS
jgi:hypothetical protein